ncbi:MULTISPECIES: SLAP domain-containing protein [Lactobacillus]|uniref:SLAP domain-containing protein n=1 Tax=Lactobacillus TaxID=1578 RepID=UPI001F2B4C6D|nr:MULTISPECIES: SLAP domain-containing protein [Lactobacillus]
MEDTFEKETFSYLSRWHYSLGAMSSMQSVQAAGQSIVVRNKAYIYNSRGYRTSTFYRKNSQIASATVKKIHGKKFYKVGKNKYILKTDAKADNQEVVVATKKTTSAKKASAKVSSSKNAASLMDYLVKSSSLSKTQRKEAKTAAKMLKTGKLNSKGAPSWFSKYVNLGAKDDSTSVANIKAGLKGLEEVNQARAKAGSKALKVSPVLMAISLIDADYQKQGGINHPAYYQYHGSLENLSAGEDPIQIWMAENQLGSQM